MRIVQVLLCPTAGPMARGGRGPGTGHPWQQPRPKVHKYLFTIPQSSRQPNYSTVTSLSIISWFLAVQCSRQRSHKRAQEPGPWAWQVCPPPVRCDCSIDFYTCQIETTRGSPASASGAGVGWREASQRSLDMAPGDADYSRFHLLISKRKTQKSSE